MALSIAIVDDLASEREILKNYLERLQAEKNQKFEIDFFTSSEEIISSVKKYNLIFFDVDMPGLNGIEGAKIIRESDEDAVIIFVTNVAQYAINGYEVNALDYVLKPVSYFDFALKMNKAMRKISTQKLDKTIVVDSLEGIKSIKVSQIFYVEVMLHYVIYHTKDGDFKTRGKISDVEKELYAYNFRRCHKSFCVNMRYIKLLKSTEVEMADGQILPIGRERKNEFVNDYISYVKG